MNPVLISLTGLATGTILVWSARLGSDWLEPVAVVLVAVVLALLLAQICRHPGPHRPGISFALILATALFLVGLKNGRLPSQEAADIGPSNSTLDAVRDLRRDVREIGSRYAGGPAEVDLEIRVDSSPDPVLGWYLREIRNRRWPPLEGTPNDANPQLIISANARAREADELPPSEEFVGKRYRIRRALSPLERDRAGVYQPRYDEFAVLWVRNDAFQE